MESIVEAWNNNKVIECKLKTSKHWVRLLTKSEYPKINWHTKLYEYTKAE